MFWSTHACRLVINHTAQKATCQKQEVQSVHYFDTDLRWTDKQTNTHKAIANTALTQHCANKNATNVS